MKWGRVQHRVHKCYDRVCAVAVMQSVVVLGVRPSFTAFSAYFSDYSDTEKVFQMTHILWT